MSKTQVGIELKHYWQRVRITMCNRNRKGKTSRKNIHVHRRPQISFWTILWKTIATRKVNKGPLELIKEMCKVIENVVKVEQKLTKSFWAAEGVRQSCPLSTTVFTIYSSKMEKSDNM